MAEGGPLRALRVSLEGAGERAGVAARSLRQRMRLGLGGSICPACEGFGMVRCAKCRGAGRYPTRVPSDYWERVRNSVRCAPDELVCGRPDEEQSLDGSPWATRYVNCERCNARGDHKCDQCIDGVVR